MLLEHDLVAAHQALLNSFQMDNYTAAPATHYWVKVGHSDQFFHTGSKPYWGDIDTRNKKHLEKKSDFYQDMEQGIDMIIGG